MHSSEEAHRPVVLDSVDIDRRACYRHDDSVACSCCLLDCRCDDAEIIDTSHLHIVDDDGDASTAAVSELRHDCVIKIDFSVQFAGNELLLEPLRHPSSPDAPIDEETALQQDIGDFREESRLTYPFASA